MLPEEKLAVRFAEKHKLKLPVNVKSLIQQRADLEEDHLPGGYDAVFLSKSDKRPRPLVILEKNRPQTRKIFTLAHELGHLVIPWHIGTHFCHVHYDARLVDELVQSVEAEANRFAAELLMPSKWVEAVAASNSSLKAKVGEMKDVGVSYLAASLRLVRFLPIGYAFVEINDKGMVSRASASGNTWVWLPTIGSSEGDIRLDQLAQDTARFHSGEYKYLWWYFAEKLKHPKTSAIRLNATDLLRQIAEETCLDTTVATKHMLTINGVIGAANGTFRRTGRGDLFTLLKHRLVQRPQIQEIVSHTLFDVFLQKRIEEISARGAEKPF